MVPTQFRRLLGCDPFCHDVRLSQEKYPDGNQRHKENEKSRPLEKRMDN
jgi:hypothetical protein